MAFTLDVALAGQESIERALEQVGSKLKQAENQAARMSAAAEKATQVLATDLAKAATNAGAATGKLVEGLEAESKLLQKTWRETQHYVNVLKDQERLQKAVHRASSEHLESLKKQRTEMKRTGTGTAILVETQIKLAETYHRLQAEQRIFASAQAVAVRGMEAQLKAAKAAEESDRKRAQRIKDLAAELKHLGTQEGKDALLLEHKIKLAKEAALAETRRADRVKALREELRHLTSEEGKKAALLELQVKRAKDAATADEQRKNRIKDLRAELKHLTSEEGKKAAELELATKRAKDLATEEQRRKNRLKDLRAEIRFLNSEQGKNTAAEELKLKRTRELATEEQRRTNRIKDLRAELRYLKSEQGQLAAELELSVKRQKELATEEQRRKNRLKDLKEELKHLNSSEGQRLLATERQIKRQKELAGIEDARRNRIKDLRSELSYLNSTEGKRSAVLEQQLRGQRELVVEEEKRRQTLQKLRSELDYLKTADGKRQELMKSELALKRQLIQEGVKQNNELAKARAARDQYSSATQRNIELARLELAEKKKADKAWAEEQLGIKKTTVAVNHHSESIRKLKAEIQFLQTAQGKEYMELERQKRQLKQTRDELLKAGTATDRFKRSVRELTTAINLSNQATAGFRAGLAGIGTSFGMFTSSTILFASAVYGVGSALKSSIQAGAEFESQMDRVNAIMDASGANTVRLTEEVRALAENTVFTAREVSDGLMYLGMAGLKTEDALTALEPSLRLASIGMLDMGTTADIVTNIMVGMGLEAEQIGEIVDDMATAITNSNMDVRQLGNAMSYVAPLAREADISLQEITASLEVLHNTGIKASRAGTAMRTSMLSLLAPTAEAMEVLQRYGIQVDDNSGRMRNWTELLTEMANAQMTLSDIKAIVGKRQAAGLKAMIDSAKATEAAAEKAKKLGLEVGKSASELKVLTQQLYENAGAAKVMQSVMEDNLRGDWLKLQAAIEEKYLEFYDMNKEELRYLVQAATDFVKSLDINDINEQFRTMAGWIAEIVQLLAAAKAGMFALGAVNMVATGANAAMSYGALGAEWLRGRKASKNNSVDLYTGLRQQSDNRVLAGMIMSGAESRKYTQTIPGALKTTFDIASSVTPVGAGRTLLAKTLQYGLQGASVGAAGYGAYSMMNSGGDYLENTFGLGREGVDYAMENRLSRYLDMEPDQLIAEYNALENAIESVAAAYNMAQEELNKHILAGNLEEAEKVRASMEQDKAKLAELAEGYRAAGRAKAESGLFGNQAEAELALASAEAAYLNSHTRYQQLSEKFAAGDKSVSPEVLEASYKSTAVWAERVAELDGTVNMYKAQSVAQERALKSETKGRVTAALESVSAYEREARIKDGLVSKEAQLKELKRQLAEEESKYLTSGLTAEQTRLALRKDTQNLTAEEVAEQERLLAIADENLKGLSNVNNASEKALKLKDKILSLETQIASANERQNKAVANANLQAMKALATAKQERDAIASKYDAIVFINEAYERGVLLLDDENYQRKIAADQARDKLRIAEEELVKLKGLKGVSQESLDAAEETVKVRKQAVELAGRERVLLSEAARFGRQQVASLESMYSTLESETIGLLERGFKDTESYFDSIVGSFKRMLAELAYQAAIKPIIVNMVASVGGMMGMGAAAKTWAGEQGVTVEGGMGNLVNMGKSAWNFWKNGGQADVSWFNDFATSSLGTSLGLSTAGAITTTTSLAGGGVALASPVPSLAGSALPMSPVAPPVGSFANTVGGQSVTTVAPATMSQGASLFSQGLSYSPWGMVGALGGSLLGVQGAENPLVNTVFTTGGSILGGMAGAAIAGGSGAAAGATAGSWAGPVGAAIGAVLGMALGGSLLGGDKSYRMRGSIYTYDEADKSPHYTYHPTAPDSEEINAVTAFGKSSIHINKYGNVEDWQEALDALVALDNLLANGMSEAEIATAKASVEGFERGGNRGDQARMEEFLYDRYSIITDTANKEISEFVKRNTETTTDLVKSFSTLNALSKEGALPSTMGGFLTLTKETDEGLFDSVARNATQAAFYQKSEGFSLPDISSALTSASVDWSAGISEVIGQALVQPEGLEGRAKEFADLFITAVAADLEYAAENANYDFSGDLSAQLDQIIADAIASLSSKDGLSAQILGEFIGRDIYEAFKQGSETQLETVNRVVGSFETISGAFDKLGLEIDEVGLDALDLTERMIKLAGGFEVLTTNLDAYYQNFYSEEERAANTMADLTEALESLGYGIPGTRAAFRGLVEELERAGNLEGFTTLINSNGSFAQFYAQMEQWTTSLFDAYRNTIGRDPSAMELYRWLDRLKTGEALFSDVIKSLTTGVSDATAHLSQQDIENFQTGAQDLYDAYQFTLEVAQEEHALALERIKQEENLLKSLRTLIDNLKLSDISPLTPAERLAEAQRQYASILTAVEGGDFSRAGELDSAAQAYLGEASSYYASSGAYESIFNDVLGSLESLENQYGQETDYEARIEAANNELLNTQIRAAELLDAQFKQLAASVGLEGDILSAIQLLPQELSAAISEIVQAVASGQQTNLEGISGSVIAAYQSVLGRNPDEQGAQHWQSQLDSGATLEEIVRGLINSDEYRSGSGKSYDGLSLTGVSSDVISAYVDLLGRAPDAQGAYYWQSQLDSGTSVQEMLAAFKNSAEYKSNGSHFGGIESVPYDGYKAILHRGEKVVPASRARADADSALVAEVRALREEVARLRSDQERHTQKITYASYDAAERSSDKVAASVKPAKTNTTKHKVTLR